MDIDVLYRCPKDLCWQYLKQFVLLNSVDIAVYKACLDPYVTKKTFWNTISRIKPNGLFCIECEPENISDVIRLVNDYGYKYSISGIYNDSRLALYIWIYRSNLIKPNIRKLYRINNWEDDIPRILANFVDYGKIVLLLGDATLPFAITMKNLSRYIIAFGDDELYCQAIKMEGVREQII